MLAANVCAGDSSPRTSIRRSTACTKARAGEARGAARIPRRARPGAAGRRRCRSRATTPQLLEQIRKRPDFALLQTVLLRSLKQAVYSPDNVGHFGLAYDAYAHFTSPIRRYPDLLVHRAIKAVLAGKQYTPAVDWEALGLHCSETERRADDATRDVESWLKCYYMHDHVGETFTGTITGVAPFGLFVTLDDSSSTAWCTSPSSAATTSSSTPRATRSSASAPASASASPTA